MNVATPTVLDFAKAYSSIGFALIPVLTNGTKCPAISGWQLGPKPDDATLTQWFAGGNMAMGVRTGDPSGNLLVIDFDKDAQVTFNAWWQLVQQNCPQALNGLVIVETPRPGYHVYVRSDAPVGGNQKLAQRLVVDKGETLVETRGTGGMIILSGSPLHTHPTNRPYQIVHGSFSQLGVTPNAVVEQLLALARTLDQMPAQAAPKPRPKHAYIGAPRPGDVFNKMVDVRDVLAQFGWTKSHVDNKGVEHWTRPGKDPQYGSSGTIGYCQTQTGIEKLYCFTSGAHPLQQNQSYDAFSIYALYQHKGDYDAAAAALFTAHSTDIQAEQEAYFDALGALLPLPKPGRLTKEVEKIINKQVATCIANQCSNSEKVGLVAAAIKHGIDSVKLQSITGTIFSSVHEIDNLWPIAEKIYRRQTIRAAITKKTQKQAKPEIPIDSYRTLTEVFDDMTKLLAGCGRAYKRVQQLVSIENELRVIEPDKLSGLFSDLCEFTKTTAKETQYLALPSDLAKAWFNGASKATLPEIKTYTRCPVFNLNWQLSPSGFDFVTGIYFHGHPVGAASDTATINSLLTDFCFGSNADRTNFIGLMLTTVLMPHFTDGKKPMGLVVGNQPGLGKTTLAQLIAVLRDGKLTGTASYKSDDTEFEKKLGSIVNSGVTTVIVDNARGDRKNDGVISSSCLEKNVTEPVVTFRLLGKSELISVENSIMFMLTANTPKVSPDLVSRSVTINLQYEGNPERRQFKFDPCAFAVANRELLLSELVGMVLRWLQAGAPRTQSDCLRFAEWKQVIGGILQVNGFSDFLTNRDDASLMDPIAVDFTELVRVMATGKQNARRMWGPDEILSTDENWRSSEIALVAIEHSLFPSELTYGLSLRAAASKIGLVASKFINEEVSGKRFRKKTVHNSGIYYLEDATPSWMQP